jgi:hypothetical protein
LPSPRSVPSRPRLPGNHKVDIKEQPDGLSPFYSQEGTA